MSPIEIFALIVAVAAIVKLIWILAKPTGWIKLIKPIYARPLGMMVVSLVLAAAVLYYLLMELTIVQIFAVMLFVAFLAASVIAVYSQEMWKLVEKLIKDKKFLKKAWLPILIWFILSVWVLYKLFI